MGRRYFIFFPVVLMSSANPFAIRKHLILHPNITDPGASAWLKA